MAVAEENGKATGPLPRGVANAQLTKAVLRFQSQNADRGVPTLVSQMRSDYQVQFAIATLCALVKQIECSVQAIGDNNDARVRAVASHLERLWVDGMQFLEDVLYYGRVATELVFDFDKSNWTNCVRKLANLPYDLTELKVNRETGDYDGFCLHLPATREKPKGETIEVPASKSWWIAIGSTPLNLHGVSKLIGAPRQIWEERKHGSELLQDFLERFSYEGGILMAPPFAKDARGREIDTFNVIQKEWENKGAGGLFLIPFDIDPATKLARYRWEQQPKMNESASLLNVASARETAQLRSFGIPEKTISEGGAFGSWASVTVQMLVTYAVAEDVFSGIATTFKRDAIPALTNLNWHPDDPERPTFELRWTPLAHRNDSLIMAVIEKLLTSPEVSPAIIAGVIDLPKILRSANIDVSPNLEERVTAMAKLAETTLLDKRGSGSGSGTGDSGSGSAPTPRTPDLSPMATALFAQLGGEGWN